MRALHASGGALIGALYLTAQGATAAPLTYNLIPGQNSSVTAVTVGEDQTNRLVEPVSLTAGQVVVDLDPGALALEILSIRAAGPGVVSLGGINGWDTATFSNATLSSTDGSPLFPSGVPDHYNYGLPVEVVATLALVGPGSNYDGTFAAPSGAGGELIAINGIHAVDITVTGVALGMLPDPSNPELPPVLVKGDFHFVAELAPEPGAAWLTALGLAALALRRRGA